uniref:Uncharacterized protein n=1 Tax=Brugia malayi TaxID=6279 RepID=A0A7I4KCK8_BRUMA
MQPYHLHYSLMDRSSKAVHCVSKEYRARQEVISIR